jgi:ABC-type nitrate/sulfonate/bicarbonate transport system permease component
MTPQESIERRMAALLVLALALIAWQAARTRPLVPPSYVSVLEPGEQVFPVSVPNWQAPEIPADRQARFAFLADRSVLWPGGASAAAAAGCDLFVRVSLHHWARRAVDPALLGAQPSTALRWTESDFLDDDDGDGDPLDAGELRAAGPGAEAEAFCRP